MMNFSASFLKIIFLASTLVAAIPQPISAPRIPAIEHLTSNNGLEKREPSGVDVIAWTGTNCDGSQAPMVQNLNFGQNYLYPRDYHSMQLRTNGHNIDGMNERLYLGTQTTCDDLSYYVFGATGCAHNLPIYGCIHLDKEPDIPINKNGGGWTRTDTS
ncbi:hypothetical protein K440DRAFT_635012 [Wilcoxina mikolae CBS 423.85]|nr:hypothetical protein K440DRAFT_635012 [Wilcoxina mikolae CBS 423.85]